MAFPKKRQTLQFTDEELRDLGSIRNSRKDEKRRVIRAAILMESITGKSDQVIAREHRISRGTVVNCVRKCLQLGVKGALAELPRPGRPRRLSDDSIVWVRDLSCQKPKDLGYSYELWTYTLLIAHVRQHCAAAGHPQLEKLSRSKLHAILHKAELRPHKIRYYVECRDEAFESKMANVLHVYKEVEIINDGLVRGEIADGNEDNLGMVTISYDEKPGMQALAVTTPDRPPVANKHASHLRDHEYKRLGTVSLLAGLDLHTGRVIEEVSNTHKSSDFIAFLKKLDRAYPQHQRLRLILDNHSAHLSKETRGYLETVPQRFEFVFTPVHGSWLNTVENLFSKMARTMLRGIRVATKQELVDRIHLYFTEINAAPVIFRWKYKMEETFVV